MLPAFAVYMAHEALRNRLSVPAWRALPEPDRLAFFVWIRAFNRWTHSTVWN